MGYWTGRFSFSAIGSQTETTGLTGAPTGCRVTVSNKSGTGTSNFSVGTCDGTRQNVQWTFGDSTGFESNTDNTEILKVRKRTSGTIVDECAAAWSSFGTSGTTGTVTFNVTALDTNVQATLEVWN